MTEQEREQRRTVANFAELVSHYDVNELKTLWRSLNKESVNGKVNFGTYENDFAVLLYLRNRIQSLEHAAQNRTLTPEEQQKAQAEELARKHHVLVSTAERYIKRNTKPAPPVEPAPAVSDAVEERRQMHERHYQDMLRRRNET